MRWREEERMEERWAGNTWGVLYIHGWGMGAPSGTQPALLLCCGSYDGYGVMVEKESFTISTAGGPRLTHVSHEVDIPSF